MEQGLSIVRIYALSHLKYSHVTVFVHCHWLLVTSTRLSKFYVCFWYDMSKEIQNLMPKQAVVNVCGDCRSTKKKPPLSVPHNNCDSVILCMSLTS